MRKCPRCNLEKLNDNDVLNDVSHTHNGVKICNDCGTQESLTLQGLGSIEDKIIQIKWENWKA
jgi:hypothetical protein